MFRRLRVVLVICGVALVPAIPVEASTAAPAVCVETNNVLFNPPLTTTPGVGLFGFNWSKTCVNTDGSVYTLQAAAEYPYAGSCVTAQISNDVTVIGGVTYIAVHKTGVLIPASGNPCNFGAGLFVGDKIDNV